MKAEDKQKETMKISPVTAAFLFVGCLLLAGAILIPSEQQSQSYERQGFTYNEAGLVEYLGEEDTGYVIRCFPFPRNRPITYMVETLATNDPDGKKRPYVGISPIPLTNGTKVAIRSIRIAQPAGASRVRFVSPVE